jgi:hypothetical protein
MSRTLSHTEIQTVTTCEFKHALSYTGHALGGDTLKPRTVVPLLRDGRAWGAGVAALHTGTLIDAYAAIDASLEKDADDQREAGVYDRQNHLEASQFLRVLMLHYAETSEPLSITRPEHELDVPIPARNGARSSRRYRFQAFLDGIHVDDDGREWIVEYKLRGDLTPLAQLYRDQQIRRYAWAAARALGINPVGVIVDERLKEVPKPARIVNAKRKGDGIDGKAPSHAKDQLTTAERYVAVCQEYGVEPSQETVEALAARRWQQREEIPFRARELEATGRQLVSAAQLIRDLDHGHRVPILNPSNAHCNGCQFREICPDLSEGLIDMSFRRTVPKRLRSDDDLAVSRAASTDGQRVPNQHHGAVTPSAEPSPSSKPAPADLGVTETQGSTPDQRDGPARPPRPDASTDRAGGGSTISAPGRSTPNPDLEKVPF